MLLHKMEMKNNWNNSAKMGQLKNLNQNQQQQ